MNDTALAGEPDADGAILALDLELVRGVAEPDRALAVAGHGAAAHLSGDLALALAMDVIDGGGARSQHPGAFAFRRLRMEALGKFLGDEAGREIAGLPARMRHQRRQKRNVVTDAVDNEG